MALRSLLSTLEVSPLATADVNDVVFVKTNELPEHGTPTVNKAHNNLNLALCALSMANQATSSSTQLEIQLEEDDDLIFGAESGWVEARTSCDHLASLSYDLLHIPTSDTPCNSCHHPSENWLCLCCKDVLCSRFVNKHMLQHYQQTNHSVALSYSDLSVWCFICDAYLDAQVIPQLRPVHDTAYILKFGQAPPVGTVEFPKVEDNQADGTSGS